MDRPTFSIVTANLDSGPYLRLCAASVADQAGVSLEHIVQDGGSRDGSADGLAAAGRSVHVERDAGMYDAINRGLRRARGGLLAYLNADEQYLPGALARVEAFFAAHPDVDVCCADTVVVDPAGGFLAYRRAVPPSPAYIRTVQLPVLTCSIFFRRRVLDEHGLYFDPAWRASGDADWVLRLLAAGLRLATLPVCTSTFTDRGDNLALQPVAQEENRRLAASAPAWARRCRGLLVAQHRLRKWLAGGYRVRALSYAIYTPASPDRRMDFQVARAGGIWRGRLAGG